MDVREYERDAGSANMTPSSGSRSIRFVRMGFNSRGSPEAGFAPVTAEPEKGHGK